MKTQWSLLPFDALNGIAEILTGDGQAKHDKRAWEDGRDYSTEFDALMRHLTSWWQGESKDPDSGRSHLWHAGCRLLFLIAYEIRGIGNDDRPRTPDPAFIGFDPAIPGDDVSGGATVSRKEYFRGGPNDPFPLSFNKGEIPSKPETE